MTLAEAIALIRPAVRVTPGATWADFGAGTGTFTEALAKILGPAGKIIAIDRDAATLHELRRKATTMHGAPVLVARGDVAQLSAIPELVGARLDGALFANVLHFIEDVDHVFRQLRGVLDPNGVVVVIEYDRRRASRWVPFPLGFADLSALAGRAGFSPPLEIGRRASRYQGELYAALLSVGSAAEFADRQ